MFLRSRTIGRPAPPRQRELPFLRRRRRLDRAFRAAILLATSLLLLGMILGNRAGRRLGREASRAVRDSVAGSLGIGIDRAEVEGRIHQARLAGIEQAREALRRADREGRPALREFLRAARIDPDSALIRWGNFDWSLALSSAVFEADDAGRSYRLKPHTRSVWLIGLTMAGVRAMFEIPDTPEARRLGELAGGRVVPQSVQWTNAWGCRGAEPDPSAEVRGIVLGDSNMQGVLVGDDQAPPSRLQARLGDELGMTVSVLNTGTLGYSPEQYYHSLAAYFDRFRPHFVVISLCANDFGDMTLDRNWEESGDWLGKIAQYCRTRGVTFLLLPLPVEESMLGTRVTTTYPAPDHDLLRRRGPALPRPDGGVRRGAARAEGRRGEARRDAAVQPPVQPPLQRPAPLAPRLRPLGADRGAEAPARLGRDARRGAADRP